MNPILLESWPWQCNTRLCSRIVNLSVQRMREVLQLVQTLSNYLANTGQVVLPILSAFDQGFSMSSRSIDHILPSHQRVLLPLWLSRTPKLHLVPWMFLIVNQG